MSGEREGRGVHRVIESENEIEKEGKREGERGRVRER